MISRETKLTDITLGDFLDYIESLQKETPTQIKGVQGLAEYLHCSVRSAQRLKSSGRIDKAIIQSGRTILFDERKLRRELSL